MADPGSARSGLERRRSKNPLRSMMQHLSVDAPAEDPTARGSVRRQSLIRRLSRRKPTSKSRSPSPYSDISSRSGREAGDPLLCRSCADWAADIEATLAEVNASFAQVPARDTANVLETQAYFLQRLKGLEENRWATTCPLCKLFWDVHVPSPGEGDYYLAAFPSHDMNYLLDPVKMRDMGWDGGVASACLGVVPKKAGPDALGWEPKPDWFRGAGMLYPTKPRSHRDQDRDDKKRLWGRELGEVIDMALPREWLQYCELHHPQRCGAPTSTATELPAFKLLDCSRSPPMVVEASLRERYAALSYVWGENQEPQHAPDPWPRVVRDAVTVVTELGLRYLWVDRLCVDMASPESRAAQVPRMGDIFEGAVVTIAAAGGPDASHGLPGVGTTSRPPQPKYTFAGANVTIVSSLRDPRLTIKESTWYTRGWTYQEALLSRRRLIFTEQQVYWECDGMACPETLALPLELYHNTREQCMGDFLRPGLFNAVSYMDGGWGAWRRLAHWEKLSALGLWREVDRHLAGYTARRLTYDEDSLDAFLGVMGRLEKAAGQGRLFHVVGIPLWMNPPGTGEGSHTRTRDLFALSTCFWYHKDESKAWRRPFLPSWTWAGWGGAVELSSSVVVRDADGSGKDRKLYSHHYVTAAQITRNEGAAAKWAYSPELVLLAPDGGKAYGFEPAGDLDPPRLPSGRCKLLVRDPLVLDRVRAQAHASGPGWTFNDVSVDAKLSGSVAAEGIRGYVTRHGRGEQMTVLWFAEGLLVMLLVVQRVRDGRPAAWERVGRMRMGVVDEVSGLEELRRRLPLRRFGEDIVIE